MSKNNMNNFDEVIDSIKKEFGDGGIMEAVGSSGPIVRVDYFPTGIMSLDIALGVGGIPMGRIIELYGLESSGKTTICLQIIASCQRHYFENKERYGKVVFIDAEHALDPKWAHNIGVDLNKLAISQPDYGEQALRIADKLCASGAVDLIVIDSVAALIPKEELDGEVGDKTIGLQARMMSQACRKLAGITSKTNTTIIFINQIREKIGITFGNPNTTPGGKALKFYSSIRCEVIKGSAVKSGDAVVGFRPTVKIVKNKVAAPHTRAQFDICVGHKDRPIYGVDLNASIIDCGVQFGIIERKGSYYRYNDIMLGNGMMNAVSYLENNKDVCDEICNKIRTKVLGVDINDVEYSVDDEVK